MTQTIVRLAFTLAVVLALPLGAAAQDGFTSTHRDVGPVIGLGGLDGASLSFGGRFEAAVKELPDLGGGILGIQGGVQYYSTDFGFAGGSNWTYLPITVLGNYHFNVSNKKFDPFVGAGLGYLYTSYDCGFGACGGSAGGIYFVGRAGLRYFMSDTRAVYVDAGAGAGSLNVGLMFKLK